MIENNTTGKLSTQISFTTFNAECEHMIKIELNDKTVFGETLAREKEHDYRIMDNFEYVLPGLNTIKISWNAEHECENKFLKVLKLLVNDQIVPNHSARIDPIENEYIRNLQSTEQGLTEYRKKIFYNGNHFGWYGTYVFQFVIDPHLLVQRQPSYSAIRGTGIKPHMIFSDKARAKHTRGQKI